MYPAWLGDIQETTATRSPEYIYIYAIYTFLGRVLTIETDDASEARERMAKKKGKKLVGAVKPSVDMGRHDVDPPKKKLQVLEKCQVNYICSYG